MTQHQAAQLLSLIQLLGNEIQSIDRDLKAIAARMH